MGPHQRREAHMQRLAAGEHGIVDHVQLRHLGYARATIQERRGSGLLVDVFHGVYLVPPHPLTSLAREAAALRACGPQSAIGLRSTAAYDGLLRWDGDVEVICPTHRRRQPGLHPRTFPLSAADIRVRDRIRRTTFARTLADLATVLGEEELERVVHEAEFRKLLRDGPVDRAIERAGARRNTAALIAALVRRRRTTGRMDSRPEREFSHFLAERGYPPSEHGVPFRLGGRTVRLDVLFRDQWFGVEVDGGPHRSEDRFHSDRRRDLLFAAEHDLPIGRVTDVQLETERDLVDATLWAALQRRDPTLVRTPMALARKRR